MNTKYRIAIAAVAGACFVGTLDRAVADDITSYSAPKSHPPLTAGSGSLCPVPGVKLNAAPIRWATPAGWNQLPATAIRIGNFLVPGANGKKAEVAITSFPGTVGTELDNVNRWRGEIGLEPVDEAGVSSHGITVDSLQAKLYDFAGTSGDTVVVSVPREGSTWFFKLRGDKDAVDQAKATFLDFLKSVHFNADTVHSPEVKAEAPSGNSHSETVSETSVSSGQPIWNPPPHWKANQAGQMTVKSFSISGDNGQNANISISVFPGKVGGVLANVNRWRAQMGLAPIKPEELSGATQSLSVAGSDSVLVDLSNPNAQAGAPARLVAAIVPQGDSTWFYKLVGDGTVVEREKDGFVKFVQAVRYP